VAVNERRKNGQTGEWEDRPNYIDCSMFGTRAEKLSAYLTKGCKVAITGKLRWSQWEKDGSKRSKVDVVVDELEFISRDGAQHTTQPAQSQQSAQGALSAYATDDIPFD